MKRDDLEAAKERLVKVQERAREVILILSVEQALLAQRLVREGGKKK